MTYTTIAGTGSYLPEKILTNHELEKIIDTSDEWIVERTGIKQRHIAAEHESSSTMGLIAAQRAIEAAGIDPNDIDMIVVATSTPDKIFPSTAVLIQEQLGIANRPAFDIGAACAGFSYGLSVADAFIRSGNARVILLVGSEVMSSMIDWSERRTCILFGDGAGAVILRGSSEPGILSNKLHADGKYKDLLYAQNPMNRANKNNLPSFVQMKGNEVFKIAVRKLCETVVDILNTNNLNSSDIDWLVPHQANLRIIQAVAQRLELPMKKVVITIEKHGNTSAASIPLALDTAVRNGSIKRGNTLLLESFGGGFTWGSSLIRF